MHIILNGFDASDLVQDQGIVRYPVQRITSERITIGGKKYSSSVEKLGYQISFDPMSEDDLRDLASHLNSDYVNMSYKDPLFGHIFRKFICTVQPLELIVEDQNGVSYWSGLTINLEEQ